MGHMHALQEMKVMIEVVLDKHQPKTFLQVSIQVNTLALSVGHSCNKEIGKLLIGVYWSIESTSAFIASFRVP